MQSQQTNLSNKLLPHNKPFSIIITSDLDLDLDCLVIIEVITYF